LPGQKEDFHAYKDALPLNGALIVDVYVFGIETNQGSGLLRRQKSRKRMKSSLYLTILEVEKYFPNIKFKRDLYS